MKFEFYFIDPEMFRDSEYYAIEVGYNEIIANVIKHTIYAKWGFSPIHPGWCEELFTYGGSTFTNGKNYAHVKNVGNEFYIYEM